MRDLNLLSIYRDRSWERRMGMDGDGEYGAFKIVSKNKGAILRVLATNGAGWDHVSVSLATRCPTWDEMEQVKRLFFREDEAAMQLHVPVADHVNCHPFCLHLWRPHEGAIPLPPAEFVGPTRRVA